MKPLILLILLKRKLRNINKKRKRFLPNRLRLKDHHCKNNNQCKNRMKSYNNNNKNQMERVKIKLLKIKIKRRRKLKKYLSLNRSKILKNQNNSDLYIYIILYKLINNSIRCNIIKQESQKCRRINYGMHPI